MARLRMEERTLPGIFPRLFSWRTHQAQDLRSRAVFWAFRIDREHCGRHSVGSALPPNGMAVPFGLASFGSCGRRQRPSVLARLGHIHQLFPHAFLLAILRVCVELASVFRGSGSRR